WKPEQGNRQAEVLSGQMNAREIDVADTKADTKDVNSFHDIDDLRGAVEAHERAILEHALGCNRWNQRQTAKSLGLTYDQLRHAIKKHGLVQ
ncbi:MAG: helix-turn-helix domain-containing protein, partial [Sphingomonadaceae bacterium]